MIIFKADKQSSIILPTAPDSSLGKYYRLDGGSWRDV